MEYSKHYFELKGKNAEEIINQLACKSFLTEWCYLNPKGENGKEICDLLVVFDDTMLIIQIKDIKFTGNDDRYIRNAFEHPIKQLFGAERNLFTISKNLELINPNGHKYTFNKGEITKIYRLVFSVGDGEVPYNFIEMQKSKIIHTFDKSIEKILNELDTISDFCKYLKDKENLCFSKTMLEIVQFREVDMVGDYMYHNKSFSHLDSLDMVIYDKGIWEKTTEDSVYQSKKNADKVSYFWDHLIDCTNSCAEDNYREIARELSRPNRFYRRCLSEAFFSAHQIAEEKNREFRRVISILGTTYCFLFTPKDFRREYRKSILGSSCFVARDKYRKNIKVIGIATEIGNDIVHSYDFVYLNMPIWSKENQIEAKRISKEFNILVQPKETPVHFEEYPELYQESNVIQSGKIPFKRKFKKTGRNDPCPCKSGKKYKKCCGSN